MAIAYKSSGAGVSTETSGNPLNVPYPSTVDANDILIVHAVFLDAVSEFGTIAGWTLLYGPAPLGTGTPTARAWVYGKLADGTEDGTSVNFGSFTTQGRLARMYSFSGWESGTITDVVPAASFTDIESESDTAMPSVTTTQAGGLAVALLAIDDNNAVAESTGETGGNWTEPTAEFLNSSVGIQGACLQIQVATPTADPGTISGGTTVSGADENSVIGFEIRPNAEGGTGHTATPADTLTLADALAKGRGKTVADTAATADLLSRVTETFRTITDPVAVTDAALVARALARTLDDTVTVADLALTEWVANRGQGDAVALTDQLTRALEISRTIADTLALTDQATPVEGGGGVDHEQPVADTVALTDQAARELAFARAVADTLTLADALATAVVAARDVADTVAVADAVARATETLRQLADTVALTDLCDPQLGAAGAEHTRQVDDTVNLLDTGTVAWEADRAGNDTINLTDQLSRAVAYIRAVADTVTVADNASVSSEGAYAQTPSDTVTVTDLLTRVHEAQRQAADLVAVADTFARTTVTQRAVTDLVAITDQLARAAAALRSFADTLALTDSLVASVGRVVTAADTVALTDSVSTSLVAGVQYARNIGDSLLVTDLLARLLTKPVGNAGLLNSSHTGRILHARTGRLGALASSQTGRVGAPTHGRIEHAKQGAVA